MAVSWKFRRFFPQIQIPGYCAKKLKKANGQYFFEEGKKETVKKYLFIVSGKVWWS
jgi:hypothetical protein